MSILRLPFVAIALAAWSLVGLAQTPPRAVTQEEAAAAETVVAEPLREFELVPGVDLLLSFTATVTGEVSLWLGAENGATMLFVFDAAGAPLWGDDDSAIDGAAFVPFPVVAGTRYLIRARVGRTASEEAPEPVTCRFGLIETALTKDDAKLRVSLAAAAEEAAAARKRGASTRELLARTRAEAEKAVAMVTRTPWTKLISPVDSLGEELYHLADFEGASMCWGAGVTAFERVLPPEHRRLQGLRGRFAITLTIQGDHARACELEERIIASYARLLPPEDQRRLAAEANHASTLEELGRLQEAKALHEQTLATCLRVLRPDDQNLQTLRMNYANTLYALGDYLGAKSLFEEVLEIRERTLPEDHRDLQLIRMNYANALQKLGEHAAAKKLLEKVLEVRERTLPPGHRDLQLIRMNYANTLSDAGDHEAARKMDEKVLAALRATQGLESISVQTVQTNLAVALGKLGAVEEALELVEDLLAYREENFPPDSPGLRNTRILYIRLLERTLATDDPDEEELAARLHEALGAAAATTARLPAGLSSRQAASDGAAYSEIVNQSLAFGGVIDDRAAHHALVLELIENIRARGARMRRLPLALRHATAEQVGEFEELRSAHARSCAALERFVANPRAGGAAAGPLATRLGGLVRAKEKVEASMTRALGAIPRAGAISRRIGIEEMAASLPPGSVGVGYWIWSTWHRPDPDEPGGAYLGYRRLAAFVLSPGGEVAHVDIGDAVALGRMIAQWRELVARPVASAGDARGERPVAPGIEEDGAVEDRHAALLEAGRLLRVALWEPIVKAAPPGTARFVVVPSGELHLVPLDALPLEEPGRVVGDRFKLELLGGLQWLARDHEVELNPRRLVAFGDVDYPGLPQVLDGEESALGPRNSPDEKGQPTWARDFADLAHSGAEIRSIARSFERAFGKNDGDTEATAFTFDGRLADKERFRRHAPGARYLHLATHGWFAPDSVPSITDRRPGDEAMGIARGNLQDDVRGYEPLSLCGLALTGANLPPRADGSHPGLLSGSEIAGLDLSGVELAVLSACETNVGERRPGQGIASLQDALFSAGVRHSITSLWNVSDEATKELMARFYDGIWRRGETKREALWAAKAELRNKKDRAGRPRHGLADWAGWVLVGPPE